MNPSLLLAIAIATVISTPLSPLSFASEGSTFVPGTRATYEYENRRFDGSTQRGLMTVDTFVSRDQPETLTERSRVFDEYGVQIGELDASKTVAERKAIEAQVKDCAFAGGRIETIEVKLGHLSACTGETTEADGTRNTVSVLRSKLAWIPGTLRETRKIDLPKGLIIQQITHASEAENTAKLIRYEKSVQVKLSPYTQLPRVRALETLPLLPGTYVMAEALLGCSIEVRRDEGNLRVIPNRFCWKGSVPEVGFPVYPMEHVPNAFAGAYLDGTVPVMFVLNLLSPQNFAAGVLENRTPGATLDGTRETLIRAPLTHPGMSEILRQTLVEQLLYRRRK